MNHEVPGPTMLRVARISAEEARAAAMLGLDERVTRLSARIIEAHPSVGPGWQAIGSDGAFNKAGLSCDLLTHGFLRFDLAGGTGGRPGCVYWNLLNIGVRLFLGTVQADEEARLAAENPQFARIESDLGWGAMFDLGSPTPVSEGRRAVILEAPDGRYTMTIEFPVSTQPGFLAATRNQFVPEKRF